jgi:hypothetical protein
MPVRVTVVRCSGLRRVPDRHLRPSTLVRVQLTGEYSACTGTRQFSIILA